MKSPKPPRYLVAEIGRLAAAAHVSPKTLASKVIRTFPTTNPNLSESDRWAAALLVVTPEVSSPPEPSPPGPPIAVATPSLVPSAAEIVATARSDRWFGTEFGLSARFVSKHIADARYDVTEGRWRFLNGNIWPSSPRNLAMGAMQAVVAGLLDEAAICYLECDTERAADPTHQKAYQAFLGDASAGPCCDFRNVGDQLTKWARNSSLDRRIGAALSGAQTWPTPDGQTLELTPDQLDQNRWALPVRDGVVDLLTGIKRPYQAGEYWTWRSPYSPDPHAPRPKWDAFLERLVPPPKRDFLERLCFYLLSGDVGEQKFFNIWGDGANGKTTFFETIAGLLPGAVGRPAPETFTVKGIDQVPNDLARLRPARLLLLSEFGRKIGALNEDLIRRWTGGDPVVARHFYRPHFEFIPQGKLVLYSSDKLTVTGQSYATWRRLVHLTFDAKFPGPGEPGNVKSYHRALLEEGDAILAWALEGRIGYQRSGLVPPEEIRNETAAFKSESDPLEQFLLTCTRRPDTREILPAADLYRCFQTWAAREGERGLADWSTRRLTEELVERGWTRRRTKSIRGWEFANLTDEGARMIGEVRLVAPPS